MKRLLTTASALALITSFGVAGGRTYAANHTGSAAHAPMMSVRLCVSTPYGVPAIHDLSRGIDRGVELAVTQWRARFRAAGMNLRAPLEMDYAKSDGSGYSTDIEHTNALRCLAQADTLGYIGTLNSGAALVSEPTLNRGAMAMISPANTNPDLTDPRKRAAQEPATYNHKINYVTYFRTVTTDNLQGPAGALYAHNALHARKFFLMDDKLTYGAGLAFTFSHYAINHLGMTQVGTGHIDGGADAASIASSSSASADNVVRARPDMVYCGCDSENAYVFTADLRRRGYTGPVVAGDAFVNDEYIQRAGVGASNNFATSVGPDPLHSARAFIRAYHQHFPGATIEAYDATSFDAANIMLNAIMNAHAAHKLATPNKFLRRLAVTRWVVQTKWHGATGVTTFDANGDTTNRIISVYAVTGPHWAFRQIAPTVRGVRPTG